jgi:hypothetical protein
MAEAGRVLRLGRTKMYELVTEYRRSDGVSGLRVVDFGGALRVPRLAVEELVGGPVHVPPAEPSTPKPPAAVPPTMTVTERQTRRRPTRRPAAAPASQLDLFGPPAAS